MIKSKFFININLSEITKIIVRHKKYKTIDYILEPGNLIEFETITNVDPLSFIITGNKPMTITSIKCMGLDKLESINILKQEINKIDIVPIRTDFLKKHHYTQTRSISFIKLFEPMVLNPNDIAMIRFTHPRLTLNK